MRIIDGLDVVKTQYLSLRGVLKRAAGQRTLEVISENTPFTIDTKDHILVIPPYGRWVNALRQGLRVACPIVMVDLKGPAGIDAAIMVVEKIGRLAYASPMVGDCRFDEYFSALIDRNIDLYPLPYFPFARLIEETDILATPRRNSRRKQVAAYAGSLWGARRDYIRRLQEAFPDRMVVRKNLRPTDYFNFLRNSLVAVDFSGAEAPTYRFSEVLLAGAACVTERRPFFVLPPIPTSGAQILDFSTAAELIDGVRFLLDDPLGAAALGESGYSWYVSSQNPSRYVEYVLAVAERRLPPLRRLTSRKSFWCSWADNSME